jgi:hypothetical protein
MSDHYRVERRTGDNSGCAHCGHDLQWTVVSGQGDDAIEIGTSWGDKELADDVCELMNMAFAAGQEQATDNSQEEMLVEFFRGEGAAMGREGDHRNWTPGYTAVHFLRRSLNGSERS